MAGYSHSSARTNSSRFVVSSPLLFATSSRSSEVCRPRYVFRPPFSPAPSFAVPLPKARRVRIAHWSHKHNRRARVSDIAQSVPHGCSQDPVMTRHPRPNASYAGLPSTAGPPFAHLAQLQCLVLCVRSSMKSAEITNQTLLSSVCLFEAGKTILRRESSGHAVFCPFTATELPVRDCAYFTPIVTVVGKPARRDGPSVLFPKAR